MEADSGEKKWSAMDWRAAACVLLRAVGHMDDISAANSPDDLSAFMRGSGFELVRVPVINGIVSSTEGRMGCLLEFQNGAWLPLLGGNEDGVVLSETGQAAGRYADVPFDRIANAWALNERILSLHALGGFFQRHKGRFVDLFLAAIIINVFGLALPLFSSFVYDKVLGNGIFETLWALVIGLVIVIGIEFCVRVLRIGAAERFAVGSEIEIDHTTFKQLLTMRSNEMPSIGALLEKYKQVLSYRDFLSSSYMLALADFPFLFLFLLAIAISAGPLVFVSIICGLTMLAVSFVSTAAVLAYDSQSRLASERRMGLIVDLMISREGIIGGAIQKKLAERWRQASVSSVLFASKARFWHGLGASVTMGLSYISFIGVLVGGVYMVEERTLTSGGLLAASLLTSRTMGIFASVNTLLLRYREFRTALRELGQLVPVTSRPPAAVRHGRLHGAVRFDKVTCRLREGEMPVFNGISFNINPGEIVGIAGAPGAGKTTLLRLIAGVLDPDEGRVLIDNIPVDQLSLGDVSQNIGYKPQDFCLLDGTIEDNVCAGRPQMSADVRHDVAMVSGLFQVFNEGALHWLTDVGVRGSCLSGGQRQLVSLARALMGRPPVLLLDEPTNGLDASLEGHLANQLSQMRGHSTVLVSTHSRNILSICDRIIVVGHSRILADGPRDKILV